ncbi:MAG: phosphatidylinositol mannoside acyltransferase [Actinomycetota bacterium]|nr:phosphatidylinositol mannoside acyltransferase [Actinomycetota bacterium]
MAGPPPRSAPAPAGGHPTLTARPERPGALRAGIHRLISLGPYLAYRGASALARALPGPVAEVVFDGLGLACSRLLRERRAQARLHLRRIHGPGLAPSALERQATQVFVSYARYWRESFRLPGTGAAELDAHMSHEGLEHLEKALAAGRGVIMAMPHVGAWDFGGAWFASMGHRTMVVAEPVEPPELFAWFSRARRSLGLDLVALGPEAGTAVLRRLRQGGIVGLLCDRDILGTGVKVELFGETTTMPSGPATLALRTGAAILPTAVYFEGRRGHHGVVRPPLSLERVGSFRDEVGRITQLLATEFEALIRRAPEQWHLLQPNWPSDPGYGR